MVRLTERAAKEVTTIIQQQKELAEKNGEEFKPLFLRVGVKGGGCSGFSYSLDLTENVGELDEQWEQEGVQIVCDPKSNLYLEGTVIDFKDEMMGRGFVFTNPNATSTCGCGSSFAV
ncbi:MAG: iron-sulfur cluster assembly accessory protein [Phycisphaerae bacterium]|nr:MAG: iron-sulfur cluster assembly accessory protein [Planctomycetota bacterium]KAB2949589.1 MAG: iron-sulfur cluster assembly accessory protein [Phycisphaerae bacterium]MBE7455869.1 iron-sulfur cluster assembly accessory protein [Planctomycetia bacterium]MCK6465278.1 iron-sulfur cluster assembly accessory protein [Phycisphaerae bacterium]MCL4717127.1 iron-sulfur cluster assembly accessory protein [Phycisphaerae bacterium]